LLRLKRLLPALLILVLACGANISTQIRLYTSAARPLIESLPLPQPLKDGLITDFIDLGNGGAILNDDLKACAKDKPCSVRAVQKFESLFDSVSDRGCPSKCHFGAHDRLVQIKRVIRGIINSALIYYGGESSHPAPAVRGRPQPTSKEAEAAMKSGMKELEQLMKPVN